MTDQTLLTICLNDFDHLQSKCGINRFENKNGSAVPDAAQNIGGNMGDAFETTHRQVRERSQNASLVGLSHFLASIPSPRAVLEYVVIDLLSDYNLRAAWLAGPA